MEHSSPFSLVKKSLFVCCPDPICTNIKHILFNLCFKKHIFSFLIRHHNTLSHVDEITLFHYTIHYIKYLKHINFSILYYRVIINNFPTSTESGKILVKSILFNQDSIDKLISEIYPIFKLRDQSTVYNSNG